MNLDLSGEQGRASQVQAGGNGICTSEGWDEAGVSPDDLGLSSLSPWAGCGADYGDGEYWGTMLKVKEAGGFSWEEGGRLMVLLMESPLGPVSLVCLISVCRSVIGN